MFIVYFNLVAITCVFSRDEADDFIAENQLSYPGPRAEYLVDFVEEDEDLYYSITSRG